MTQLKHTPAPWNIRNEQSTHKDWEHIDANDIQVAKVRRCGLPERSKQFLPNAHLIAAAPELLEALESCCHYIFENCPQTGKSSIFGDHVLIIQNAEKAIKKAKGE